MMNDPYEALNELAEEVHDLARLKGWHDEPRSAPELLCLIHSEVSEALEAYRDGHTSTTPREPDGKPEGVGAELADVLIRTLDTMRTLGYDPGDEVQGKHLHNQSRSHRHGGKRL